MNKLEIISYAEECQSKINNVLMSNKMVDGQPFTSNEQRWSYIAGMQSTLIKELMRYIKTH